MSEDMFVCFHFVDLKLCNCGNALNMKLVQNCTGFIFCAFPATVTTKKILRCFCTAPLDCLEFLRGLFPLIRKVLVHPLWIV